MENTPSDILCMENVWFGTSVGGEKGKHRIFDLLQVKCKVRFISFEPLHQEINLQDFSKEQLSKIHWAILGGESGNNTGKYRYRECKVEWMENIIRNLHPNTAVFVKQMGTFLSKELKMSDRHGTELLEFPANLQRREFPFNLF